MVFFSKIESKFTVSSRGCVVVPVALTDNPELRVRAGDVIQFRSPSGCLDARIKQIEWLTRRPGLSHLGFLLSEEINESQIPLEAEIWVERSK
jgi:hypothetical protein